MSSTKSKLSRLQCKPKSVPSKEADTTDTRNSLNTTPVSRKNYSKDDTIDDDNSSPFLLRFTQDSCEDDMDVIWDWDSPKSHTNHHIHRKRILHSSPNIPRKQLNNDKSLPKFNSLKAELEQLSNFLQIPNQNPDIFIKPKTPEQSETTDLFADDFLDEEMFKCSQQIEDSFNIQKLCNSVFKNKSLVNDTQIQDDSFDCFLEEIKDDDLELFSQNSAFDHPTQPLIIKEKETVKPASPRSISRTNSVPAKFLSKLNTPSTSGLIQKTKSEEIKKSMQCSPEEIEQKRLEAKAKLEYKRKEKEIERKRHEALERLKRNRMQRLMMSQNSAQQR